jgi:hypothetical protein
MLSCWLVIEGKKDAIQKGLTMRGFTALTSSIPNKSLRICGDTLEPIQKTIFSSLSGTTDRLTLSKGKHRKAYRVSRLH